MDQNTRQIGYTRAGLPECVVSTMTGPLPKTTQDRIQTKDIHPIPGQKLKFLTPPGWKAGTLPTTSRRRMGFEFDLFYSSIFLSLISQISLKFSSCHGLKVWIEIRHWQNLTAKVIKNFYRAGCVVYVAHIKYNRLLKFDSAIARLCSWVTTFHILERIRRLFRINKTNEIEKKTTMKLKVSGMPCLTNIKIMLM